MSQWSPDVYNKAWQFSAKYHDGQTYDGLPYMTHIGSVAMEVIWGMQITQYPSSQLDPNLAIQCALLHDTIEDTSVTYEMVVEQFGKAVADGVLALTKDKTLPSKAKQMADSLQRICQQPQEVWMVKMADRISNLLPPPQHWTPEKIAYYRAEAIEIHKALQSANQALADRLQAKIATYK